MDDEFFTMSSTIRRTHHKYVTILLTGSENEGDVQSVRPGHAMQFCLQRKEYPASPIDFKTCQSPLQSFDKWTQFMISQDCVKANLTKAQIINTVIASATLRIRKDIAGLITFIYRWCPDTHKTICRWGEMTIYLESVAILLNLPITRNFNITFSDEEEKMHTILVKKSAGFVRKENETKCSSNWWVSEWFPGESGQNQELSSMLHVAAFLVLWLSRDIVDGCSGKKEIKQELIKFSIKLAKGVILLIGCLFLGSWYTYLDPLTTDMHVSNGYIKVDSYVQVALLQAWLWEHFKNYAPNSLASFPESHGGSRILRWWNKRPKAGSNLIDFLDNVYAINFRPWAPVYASIVHANTFASAPNKTFIFTKNNMRVGEIIFMRSYIPVHVSSFFRGSYEAVPYNIDRAARHMGFDQGVLFLR
ncbi:uncharacterized protein LOC113306467 [Papaver somniferum]|uniref:uncharacterized protein LOC113306467 n=1 Tax=Papaver somniferum TaxID=3469 RepID=UPI000E7022CF|nr:uncharacterized protein LOC113306467 [Papaver somniferum]